MAQNIGAGKPDRARRAAACAMASSLAVGIVMFAITFFHGDMLVMVQGIVGAFFVRIPVSFFMSRLVPVSLFKIGLATPCSTLVQIIICSVYFCRMLHREKQNTL